MSLYVSFEGWTLHGGFMKKKRDKTIFLTSGDDIKRYFRGWFPSRLFAPIQLDDAYERSRRSFIPLSLWERFTAWSRYYSIQIWWDIERWLARRLHRRWP